MSGYDEFHDVRQKVHGSLGGDAWDEHESVKSELGPQGLRVQMPCGGCGAPKMMTLDWGELVAIKCHVSPSQAYGGGAASWVKAPAKLVFQIGSQEEHWMPYGMLCGRCQRPLELLLSPSEAAVHVRNGLRAGWLNPQHDRQYGQACVRAGGYVKR